MSEPNLSNIANPKQAERGSLIPAVAITALLLVLFTLYRTEISSKSASGIYVVDGLRLTRSYQAATRNDRTGGAKSPEQMNREAFALEQAINAEIASMAKQGRIIVQKQSVWAYPPEADITAEIAAAVGITLSPDEPLPPAAVPATVPTSLPADTGSEDGAELD